MPALEEAAIPTSTGIVCPAIHFRHLFFGLGSNTSHDFDTWDIVPHELQHRSSASSPMICAVSLQKSAHVCARKAPVFMCASCGRRLSCVSLAGAPEFFRDSVVASRFNGSFLNF